MLETVHPVNIQLKEKGFEEQNEAWDQRLTLRPPPYKGAFKKYLRGLEIGDPLIDNLHQSALLDHASGVEVQKFQMLGKGCPFLSENDFDVDDPEWVDWELVEKGQKIWAKHLGRVVLALSAALLVGFNIARFAEVLIKSGYADNDKKAFDRYAHTAYAVIDWFTEDLHKGGKGRKSALTVRKMHGFARRKSIHLFDRSKGEGVPLSQYDMAEVLLGFAIISLEFMNSLMEVEPSLEEKRAMTATWRLLGYQLGIMDEFNPCVSFEELQAVLDDYKTFVGHRFNMKREATIELQRAAIHGFGNGTGLGTEFFKSIIDSMQLHQQFQSLEGFDKKNTLVNYERGMAGMPQVGEQIWKFHKNEWVNHFMNDFYVKQRNMHRTTSKTTLNIIYKAGAAHSFFMDKFQWKVVVWMMAHKRTVVFGIVILFLSFIRLIRQRLGKIKWI